MLKQKFYLIDLLKLGGIFLKKNLSMTSVTNFMCKFSKSELNKEKCINWDLSRQDWIKGFTILHCLIL